MVQHLISIFMVLLLTAPAFGADWTVKQLTERLAEAKVELTKYRTEYERLKTIGYGGPVLRKDLEILGGNVAALIHEIQGINQQLSGIEATPLIGDATVSLKATKESYDGPPLKGPLESGDIIALQGTVKIPGEEGAMFQSYLTWQLFDSNGEQVGDYYKRDEVWETGEHKTKVRFLINELKSGQYTAALTHIPADDPAKMAQAKVSFAISMPLSVNNAWVTDTAGGSEIANLGPGKTPYFYVTFVVEPGIETVNVQLRAKDTGTGKDLTLEIVDYVIKPDKKEQRIGIMLEEHTIKDVSGVSFEARLTLPDGHPTVVERSVSLAQKTYALKLRAAPMIMSGKDGKFMIMLPEEFVPPYTVRFSSGGLKVRKSANPLKGTFRGTAQGADKNAIFNAFVVDSEGRRAEGAASVTIKAADAKVVASQEQQTLYSKPKPFSQSTSSQSSGPDENGTYGSTGRQRVSKVANEIAMGIGPSCARSLTDPYRSAMVDYLHREMENDGEMVRMGKLSHFEFEKLEKKAIWIPLGRALAKAVAASPSSDCYQTLLRNWVAAGNLSSSEAQNAIAANKNGGSGGAPPQAAFGTPGSKEASSQQQCTKTSFNMKDCRSAFYECTKKCPQGVSYAERQACLAPCDNANNSCKKAKCPNGSLSGVGWNLTCTVCR